MTEIQHYQGDRAPSPIQHTANEMATANRIANAIANSTFVPSHFRGKADECTVAMLYGATIGLDPMTSVQQIYVISGKPALYARAMVAIVLAAGHEIWVEEEKDGSVTVAGKRKGSENIQRVTWTAAMAERAGYTSNRKYQTDPQSMLYARASGDLARRLAPDALLGMAYNVEEMTLVGDERPARTQATTSAKDRVRAAIASPQTPDSAGASADPAPEAPPAAPPAESADTTPKITSAQSKKLHATYRDLGITERPDRLAFASRFLGRQISTSCEITKDEATRLIEAAAADVAAARTADEDGVVEGEVVDEPDERAAIWDACTARAAELGMNLWTLPQDFEQAAGVAHANATADLLRFYLQDLNGRTAA